jgi:hypothetical protein
MTSREDAVKLPLEAIKAERGRLAGGRNEVGGDTAGEWTHDDVAGRPLRQERASWLVVLELPLPDSADAQSQFLPSRPLRGLNYGNDVFSDT